ncbi:hypothetical protein MPLSOD_270078 [Mesorhizobium sp. SOD10]|nr:hypothetical protein MPLSOD_270078 [Mesorhizobium sp. SOD10]
MTMPLDRISVSEFSPDEALATLRQRSFCGIAAGSMTFSWNAGRNNRRDLQFGQLEADDIQSNGACHDIPSLHDGCGHRFYIRHFPYSRPDKWKPCAYPGDATAWRRPGAGCERASRRLDA